VFFRTVPSPTPYSHLFPKIGGSQPPPKTQLLLSQEWLKLWSSNLARTFTPSIRTKAHKNFGEKGAWAYPGTAQIFWMPPVITRTGKAMNFEFGRNIHNVHQNEIPLNILEKRERWCIQGLHTFLDTPYYFRNR